MATAKPGFETPRVELAGGVLFPIGQKKRLPVMCSHHPEPLVAQQAVTGEAKPARVGSISHNKLQVAGARWGSVSGGRLQVFSKECPSLQCSQAHIFSF